jgi:hypothetical protein
MFLAAVMSKVHENIANPVVIQCNILLLIEKTKINCILPFPGRPFAL